MKKTLYILLLFSFMTCKNNEAMKMESTDMEVMSVKDENDFDRVMLSSEAISIKKLEEYMNLIQLKQEHPEFEDDIILQLRNFTLDSLAALNYPKGFTISDVKIKGKPRPLTNTQELLSLKFTVISPSKTFKDSIGVMIKSEPIELDGKTQISREILFLSLSGKP
ncbi:hypothetical protein [Psychroserpens luteus]|uniref:Uncharacterized protein n=1 Tax=Psychroserpens luteus TaxID=1434066 RepID=A0ABW5ZXD5_9FLAO|nr:hypothetical protein [Psychroserpens luteus]